MLISTVGKQLYCFRWVCVDYFKFTMWLLYSSGLGLGELINLKIGAIDSGRMLICIVGAKGNKERYTFDISKTMQE